MTRQRTAWLLCRPMAVGRGGTRGDAGTPLEATAAIQLRDRGQRSCGWWGRPGCRCAVCVRHGPPDCSDTSDVGSARRPEHAARFRAEDGAGADSRGKPADGAGLGETRSPVPDVSGVSLDTEPSVWVCKSGVKARLAWSCHVLCRKHTLPPRPVGRLAGP